MCGISTISFLGSFPFFAGKETHYWISKISQIFQALLIACFEDYVKWEESLKSIYCCSDTSPLVWTAAVCSGLFLKIAHVRSVVCKLFFNQPFCLLELYLEPGLPGKAGLWICASHVSFISKECSACCLLLWMAPCMGVTWRDCCWNNRAGPCAVGSNSEMNFVIHRKLQGLCS